MGVNEKKGAEVHKKNISGQIFLGIFSIGLLGVGVYYVFFNEQQKPVAVEQDKALRDEEQTKKQKPKKVILDPVIDNIYWSIASFAVYYSVYLGLKHSDYKDQAFWVIPTLIVLEKLGLVTFSSFYYQKNSFLQNLNKSINPAYFIHQDIYQIVLSLVGYLGLTALIYFDRKKPEQLPGGQQPGNQILNQNNHNQNEEENKNNNELNLAIQNNLTSFQNVNNLFEKNSSFVDMNFYETFILLQNSGFNEFNDAVKKGIRDGRISQAGIKNLINGTDFINVTIGNDDYFLGREEYRKTSLINCLVCFLTHFVFDGNDKNKKETIKFFLNEIIKDPSDNRIAQLKELINELFYFTNCATTFIQNMGIDFATTFIQMTCFYERYYPFKNIFKNTQEVQDFHLNFLRKIAEKANLILPNQQQNIPNDKKIEEYYKFFKTKAVEVNNNNPFIYQRKIYQINNIDGLVAYQILENLFNEREVWIQQQANQH